MDKWFDNFKYQNRYKEIYELIDKNEIDKFKYIFYEIEDTVRFFQLILKAYHSVISGGYIDWLDFGSVVNISKDMNPYCDDIELDLDLLINVYSHTHTFFDYLRLLFNPEVYSNIPRLAVYPTKRLFDVTIEDFNSIHSDRLRLFFKKIDECRKIKDDNVMIVLLLYGHVHNNYDALNKYLENYKYFSKYFYKNKQLPKDFCLVSDEVITMFENMDNFLPSQNIAIR